MKTNETGFICEHRAIDRGAIDGIDPVEHEIFLAAFTGGFEGQAHRGGICIKPADIYFLSNH